MTCWQWQILRFPKKLPFGVLHYPVIQEIFVLTQEIFSTHSVFSRKLNIVDCEFLNTKILYTAIIKATPNWFPVSRRPPASFLMTAPKIPLFRIQSFTCP